MHGVLVLNKPGGPSSAFCLNFLKRLGQKKIGHGGTLDPMATGVLLVLLGHATKISNYLLEGGKKIYSGRLLLGQTTDTWDAEGLVTAEADWRHVSEEDARREIESWQGSRELPVPPYSAAKHQGKPLYALARSGKPVPEKRKVMAISHAEALETALPHVRFRVTCSSGAYIRSLAHSLGTRFGCGAVLTELTREYSHPFGLERAVSPEEIRAEPERLGEWVLPLSEALPAWPRETIGAEDEAKLRNGRALPAGIAAEPGGMALLQGVSGEPLALARAELQNGELFWTIARGLWQP